MCVYVYPYIWIYTLYITRDLVRTTATAACSQHSCGSSICVCVCVCVCVCARARVRASLFLSLSLCDTPRTDLLYAKLGFSLGFSL